MSARRVIDRLTESPYYRLLPSQQNLSWGKHNNVEIRNTPHIPTINIEAPSMPAAIGDVKFTSCDPETWRETEAFLATKEPGEKAYYVKVYTNGSHQGTYLALLTDAEFAKLQERNRQGQSMRVKNELR